MEPSPEPTRLMSLGQIDGPMPGLLTVFAAVRSIRKGQTRTGKPYFELRLSDRSRTMTAKVWSDASRAMHAMEEIQVGTHIKALFEVETFHGAPQLTVRGIRPIREGEPDYDPAALVEEGLELVQELLCSTLVFDIETVPA